MKCIIIGKININVVLRLKIFEKRINIFYYSDVFKLSYSHCDSGWEWSNYQWSINGLHSNKGRN